MDIVYFSSVSENTKRFVEKLGIPAYRIPIPLQDAFTFTHDKPFVLITPTYGGGNEGGAVPKQVIKFLNNSENRKHVRAIIAGGNTNFGAHFCKAGYILSDKLNVPLIYRFEVLGTPEEVQGAKEAIANLC